MEFLVSACQWVFVTREVDYLDPRAKESSLHAPLLVQTHSKDLCHLPLLFHRAYQSAQRSAICHAQRTSLLVTGSIAEVVVNAG
jgi:hypothetical protein